MGEEKADEGGVNWIRRASSKAYASIDRICQVIRTELSRVSVSVGDGASGGITAKRPPSIQTVILR